MCCTSALRAAPAFNSKKGTKLKVFSRVCLADSRALQNFHCSVKPYRHTAMGLLESPPVTSGGDLVSGLELKHKLCLGDPTPSCRLDHCSRARSSEVPAVHAVHLLQSQILQSGWKHLPPWAGSKAPSRTPGQAVAQSKTQCPASLDLLRGTTAVSMDAALRDRGVWQDHFPVFHRNEIPGRPCSTFTRALWLSKPGYRMIQ